MKAWKPGKSWAEVKVSLSKGSFWLESLPTPAPLKVPVKSVHQKVQVSCYVKVTLCLLVDFCCLRGTMLDQSYHHESPVTWDSNSQSCITKCWTHGSPHLCSVKNQYTDYFPDTPWSDVLSVWVDMNHRVSWQLLCYILQGVTAAHCLGPQQIQTHGRYLEPRQCVCR